MSSGGERVHQALEKREGWTKLGRTGWNPEALGAWSRVNVKQGPRKREAFGKDVVKSGHRSCCYVISVLTGPLYVELVK